MTDSHFWICARSPKTWLTILQLLHTRHIHVALTWERCIIFSTDTEVWKELLYLQYRTFCTSSRRTRFKIRQGVQWVTQTKHGQRCRFSIILNLILIPFLLSINKTNLPYPYSSLSISLFHLIVYFGSITCPSGKLSVRKLLTVAHWPQYIEVDPSVRSVLLLRK